MLRLGVFDLASSIVGELNSRLRDATLVGCDESAYDRCDAIVCNASNLDAARLHSFVQNEKLSYLLVDDASASTLKSLLAEERITTINPDRYLPSHQLIRQQLDAGKLGEPGLLRVHRWDSAPQRLRDLDLTLWYFGKTPNLVFALENASCTQIHLGFPNGGMALLEYATRLPQGDTYYSVSLIGSHGAAYADDHANMQLAYQGGSPRAVRADETIAQWTAMVQAIVTAIGSDHANDTRSTWPDVFAVNDAIDESLRTRQSVVPVGAR